MPVQSITAEMVGLSGRIRAGRRSSRSSLRRITPQDVWPAQPAAAPRERKVSGDWLASVLHTDKEIVALITGREVIVEEEAWFGVQALLNARLRWSSRRRKIARQRAGHWPAQQAPVGAAPLIVEPAGSGPCACPWIATARPRFVDSKLGSDGYSGGFESYEVGPELHVRLRPWKTLCQVETWLNELAGRGACVEGAQVHLRRGRVWTGDEEPGQRTRSCPCAAPVGTAASWEERLKRNRWTGTSAALTVMDFKATQERPLVISAYGDEDTNGSESRPLIDGCSERDTGARYGRTEVGILFYDCCYVLVSDIQVRGFGFGVEARRASKHHVYENVRAYDNARCGFQIGTTDGDLGTSESAPTADIAAAIAAGVTAGLYPFDIAIVDCLAYSNGYDTAGADIGLGFLATNCTLSGNTLKGGPVSTITGLAPRGIDGVVSQGGSSGHLIEKNRIGEHRAWCTGLSASGDSLDATIGQMDKCSTRFPTVLYPCSTSTSGDCVDLTSEYGYFVKAETRMRFKDTAIGEDGIDLKGVFQRTPDAKKETIVCDNVIWGQRPSAFTGITVNDGSRDVYIFRNRIFQNNTGIYVGNNGSGGWYREAMGETLSITQDVYIYRNLVYMNEQQGIHVENAMTTVTAQNGFPFQRPLRIENVWIVNNTVAHNLWTGVHVQSVAGYKGVSGVFMYNNLIARNGIAGSNVDQSRQVTWSAGIDLMDPAEARSDYNCYLGWDGDAGPDLRWDGADKSRDQAATDWGIETYSQQVADLGDLGFFGGREFATAEGRLGADLQSYVQWTATSAVIDLDYDVAGFASAAYRAGIIAVGVNQPNSTADLTQSVDIDGVQAFAISPTVGAFEGPT